MADLTPDRCAPCKGSGHEQTEAGNRCKRCDGTGFAPAPVVLTPDLLAELRRLPTGEEHLHPFPCSWPEGCTYGAMQQNLAMQAAVVHALGIMRNALPALLDAAERDAANKGLIDEALVTSMAFARKETVRLRARLELAEAVVEGSRALRDITSGLYEGDPDVTRRHFDRTLAAYDEAMLRALATIDHFESVLAVADETKRRHRHDSEERLDRDEAVRLLREVEWWGADSQAMCPCCAKYDHEGHAADCALATFLATLED